MNVYLCTWLKADAVSIVQAVSAADARMRLQETNYAGPVTIKPITGFALHMETREHLRVAVRKSAKPWPKS